MKIEDGDGDGERFFTGLITHIVFAVSHPNKGDLLRFEAKHIANIIPREYAHTIDKKRSK